ncbi:MAG TPA: hypothetical protein VKJ65_02045, partial [Phycisphaerae bacterium]|nr:hypothetical protein [Phycisphaerae bacterium]
GIEGHDDCLSSQTSDYAERYFKIGETMGRQTRKNLLTNNTAARWLVSSKCEFTRSEAGG